MKNFASKIYNSILEMRFFLLYVLIFALLCIFYNFNNQTLNYFLKRGTILEYSQDKKNQVDINLIKKNLAQLNIFYSSIKEVDEVSDIQYSKYNNADKKLIIALPYLPKEDKKELFNSVSDIIFNNYQNSKLVSVKPMNDSYLEPYSAFGKTLFLSFFAFIFWIVIVCIFCDRKTFFSNAKKRFYTWIENIKGFFCKTKEKGAGYLFKSLLFDEYDDGKEIDYTKETINTIVFVLACVVLIRCCIGELRWIPSGSMIPTFLEGDRVFVEKIKTPKKQIKRGDILVFYPPGQMLDRELFSNTGEDFANIFKKNESLKDNFTYFGSFFADLYKIFSRYTGIACKDIAYIKRVVGMPNEKFEIKYNKKNDEYKVYINDEPLFEPYIKFNEYFLLYKPYYFTQKQYKNSNADWTPCENSRVEYCGPFIIPENSYFMMGDNRGNSEDSRFWGFLEEERIIGRANFLFFPFKRINILRDKYLELNEEKTNNGYTAKLYIINRYELL